MWDEQRQSGDSECGACFTLQLCFEHERLDWHGAGHFGASDFCSGKCNEFRWYSVVCWHSPGRGANSSPNCSPNSPTHRCTDCSPNQHFYSCADSCADKHTHGISDGHPYTKADTDPNKADAESNSTAFKAAADMVIPTEKVIACAITQDYAGVARDSATVCSCVSIIPSDVEPPRG